MAPVSFTTSGCATPRVRVAACSALALLLAFAFARADPAAADEPGGAPLVRTDGLEEPLPADDWGPLELLGESVRPGELRQLTLVVSASLAGVDVETPISVQRGAQRGMTLCLTAGVHGDEVNGVEIVRRVIAHAARRPLRGTLIGVPIVNVSAVRRSSRYLPDRRDLNRYFPGRANGSAASRIANRFFANVISHCDALVDLHTGSFHRSNLHQLRADLTRPRVMDLARGLGSRIVVHNSGRAGTLRGAAVAAGIPAVTIEGGEPVRLSTSEVELGVRSLIRLLHHLGMQHSPEPPAPRTQEFYDRALWIRASSGGILVTRVSLGQTVARGEELAVVTDPISSRKNPILSPRAGRIIGMAFDQLVMPGFATFHLALHEGPPGQTPGPGLDGEPDAPHDYDEFEMEERPE